MGIYDPGAYGIVGPMFSGKTDEMIGRLRRYEIAGMPVQAFRYGEDTRYDNENMASLDGRLFPAAAIKTTQDVIDLFDQNPKIWDAKVYAFDEVQFLDYRIIELLEWLAHDKIVIYNGLDLDFRREWFRFQLYPPDPNLEKFSDKTMRDLIDVSDDVKILTAVCTFKGNSEICGRAAAFSQRLIDGKPAPYNSPLILIGSKEVYEPHCGWHHEVPGRPRPNFLAKLKL